MERGELVLDPARSYQAEALQTMAAPGRYAFQWANGTAKTTTAALFVLFFLDCYPGARVLTTAGTWSQLKEQLWREIATWADRTKAPSIFDFVKVDKTQIDIAPDWAAFGRAADRAETFEGVHGRHVLVLMDEAKAIKPGIFDSVRRILRESAGSWWICLSSPGSPSGPFYDITNGDQAQRWHTFKCSAYESERVDLQTIEDDIHDLGKDSPLVVSMDYGEFPDEADNVIVPLSWAQAAVDRPWSGTGPMGLSVDVARLGPDETVLGRTQANRFDILDDYRGKRTTETAGRIRALHDTYPFEWIVVDDGPTGGVVDMCLEQGIDIVEEWNASASAANRKYYDRTTEALFSIRAELEQGFEDETQSPDIGLSLPPDKLLLHQLTARKYVHRQNGQVKVESKDDMRKRGERSPDRLDAFVMGYQRARSGQGSTESLRVDGDAGSSRWGKI